MLSAGREQLCLQCRKVWRRSRLPPVRCLASRKLTGSEVFTPATFSKLEVADRAPLVSAYTTNGFVIQGARVMGSVALLPRGLLHWKISKFEDLVPEAFTLFHLIEPQLDLVVLGTGTRVQKVEPAIAHYLKKKGINLEVQDTPNACATFNFLLEEGRPAGAALIPPDYIPP